ncbi:LacI family DNA-binding transcriptional regulator [Fulvivirga sediminis]|uniref:Substrate-binding domain-containing protein n=1 Tax=Fulvivirga sediminis TaxID=2803949 RepID=A0A937FDE8_9BACT|nr:substrate-binding domain-containing protein [Fulvivirga sediminis]MBL3658498.1 substrate-binding domain-containing protein [Fulvivirga sediminis]
MKKQKFSIKDIATSLNISKTTVSFILNGKAKEKRISQPLVDKVLKFVEEVGYTPNQFAQSLRTGKTKILGLMVEDISNPFFAQIARNIEDRAYEAGYKIIYCSTENDKEKSKEFLQMFQRLGVDGYIITPTPELEEDIRPLVDSKANLILLDRNLNSLETDYVMVNNAESAYEGTKHLIRNGFRKISFITISSNQTQMTERKRGYEEAMNDHALQPLVHEVSFKKNYTDSVAELKAILNTAPEIDAILFGANYLGVAGLEAISELNMKIPEDLGVVSFDDNDLFRINKPSITAIAQPIEQISETAINRLIDQINSDQQDKNKNGLFLSTTLIPRESSQK